MVKDFREALQDYSEEPITRQVLLDILKDYKRPYDKISELVSQGVLTRIKRGIYIPGSKLNIIGPEPFLLANFLYGPSYVSTDTALSYWNLIPERVYETSSVTIKPSRTFKTTVGRFTYLYMPLPYYSFGVKSIVLSKKQTALIASQEKALCDKIITTPAVLLRSIKQAVEFLEEDLRIGITALRKLDKGIISSWIKDAPKKESLEILVKTLNSI